MERNKKKTAFQDEFIIQKRRETEKQNYMSVQSGMYAGNEFITFSENKLFDGCLAIYLPDTFADMPEEYRRVKYPSEDRPQILKSNIKGDAAFSFQLVDQSLQASELEATMERFCRVLKRAQPFNLFFDSGLVKGHDVDMDIAWMDYKAYGVDQPIYQLLYTLPAGGRMMMGMFHCPFYAAKGWKPVAKAVLGTIRWKDMRQDGII